MAKCNQLTLLHFKGLIAITPGMAELWASIGARWRDIMLLAEALVEDLYSQTSGFHRLI